MTAGVQSKTIRLDCLREMGFLDSSENFVDFERALLVNLNLDYHNNNQF